ncbi:phosphotriesterase family protein [Tepidanaerobacter syntrophicus]|uniref:phosphotriesterase family protein n=1 Tax=Tepidanaerobacter syntrophicus TaxID=224999 RepID=UPI001BD49F22|nr:hypothetical protein [Tepidanaerobacter syntrophicus]
MSKIMTVLGEIKPEDLRFTSMHEHIMMRGGMIRKRYEDKIPANVKVKEDDPVKLDNIGLLKRNFILSLDGLRLDDEETMMQEVYDFKESGGASMLELSAIGLRCNLPAIKRISQKTGVNVIAATGFYTEDSWPLEYRNLTIDNYKEIMLKEINFGIEDTGIKPGHIKIGISTFSKQEENTLRAAGRVAKETGLSITVHPSSKIGGNSVNIAKILLEEGVKPDRIVIAHVSATFAPSDLKMLVLNPESWKPNLDTAKSLLNLGVNITVDFLGNSLDIEFIGDVGPTDWQKLAGLVALLKDGYAEHIVLGTDLCAKIMTRRFGGEGYCRLTNFAIPTLRDLLGVSEYAIRQMTIKNPARILAY